MDASGSPAGDLLAIYDDAVPQIYSYFRNRVPHTATAEDLTAETFLAAVAQIDKRGVEVSHHRLAGRDRPSQTARPLAPDGSAGLALDRR